MSMISDYNSRQLVPRLLSFETSNTLSLNISTENFSSSGINSFEVHNYSNLKSEWEIEKNVILAIQILIYEIIYDSLKISYELIEYLNKSKHILNDIENEILFLANIKFINGNISSDVNSEDDAIIIKKIKKGNLINPLNPIQWCNLGYFYTKLGLKEKAKKAFLVSIGLNNNNRHIVRSVSRFFLHIGNKDFSHHILAMSPRIKYDPSIISAEIALSELIGKKSKFIDNGIRLINDENISTFEKNELLAQIATLEFAHGKNSKGRMFIDKCLINPNENSLAQIAFLTKKRLLEPLIENVPTVIFQFEALARNYFIRADFKNAFENAKKWFYYQPFSNNPAALSTYIASAILGDYQSAIDIANLALKTSPDGFILLNNLAFSYARNNQIKEAIEVSKKINIHNIDDYDKAILNATNGYIAFKQGYLEIAKIGYNEAIKYFRTIKDDISLARALYNYSSILNESEKKIILKEVAELSIKNDIVELVYLLKKDDIIDHS